MRFSLPSTTSGAGRASIHISSSPTHLTSFYSYNIILSDLQQLQLKPKTMKTSSYSLYILCFPLSHCLQQEPGPEIPDVYFLRFVNYLRHVNIKASLGGRNFTHINTGLQPMCYRITLAHNNQEVRLRAIHNTHCIFQIHKIYHQGDRPNIALNWS